MAENLQDQNTPLRLFNFWKLLNSKVVSLGTPAILVGVALDFARKSEWEKAGLCVFAAAGVWVVIKIGSKIAPSIDKLWDWILNNAEKLVLDLWGNLTFDFEGKYYERLKFECRKCEIRGINLLALQLENVFVPLKIEQTSAENACQNIIENQQEPPCPLEQLEIGKILVQMASNKDRRYKRLAILGASGSGKTTLLLHITLSYATRRQRRLDPKAPKLIPVLLRLRDVYQEILQQPAPPLVKVIENAVLNLQRSDPLKPRAGWFGKRLRQGKCLVMLDGLDEVPDDDQRQKVSEWVSEQINEYRDTPFILTSRPEGYKKARLRDVAELEVQPFNREQRNQFINDWYLHRKQKDFENKVDLGVRDSAMQQAKNLIEQIDASPSLRLMARNPLLLNMIAITHEKNLTLSTKPVDLYKEICRVLLAGRQRATGSLTLLSAEQKQIVLESLALELMQQNLLAFTLDESSTRKHTFKQAKSLIQENLDTFPHQKITPEEFIKKDDIGVRELLSEREQEEIYEFAHKTFQEYLAAVAIKKLSQTQKEELLQKVFANEQTLSWWRETIRFYAAQTDASDIIQAALNYQTVPVLTLAYQCGEEAQQITSQAVRTQLQAKFKKGLNSDQLDEFTVAAEVRLTHRLNQLNHDLLTTESDSEIVSRQAFDSSYITGAEYQLFLNQTNSPTTLANKKQALQPQTNISFWDANRFCAWLSLRSRKELSEAGICYRPATEVDRQQHACTEDQEYADRGGIRLVRFQVPSRYAQLAYYLAAGMWREADKETYKVMLKVAQREKEGYLELEDIRQFPCQDLRTIDQLWVQYSNGHFGFSVQKKIFLEVGGRLEVPIHRSPIEKLAAPLTGFYDRIHDQDDQYDAWERFCSRVGYRVKEQWISYSEVTFDISAQTGHLPFRKYRWGAWGAYWGWWCWIDWISLLSHQGL
jgi:hypothetical protein